MSRQNSRDVSSLEVTLNGSQIEIDPIGNGTKPFDDVKVLLVKGQDGVGSPYTDTPSMDGTGDAGSSALYSRGDHVHPSDTSRQPVTLGTPITINGTEQTTVEGALGTIPTAMFKGSDYVTAGRAAGTTAGAGSTAEGHNNTASGNYCHCEGGSNKATAAYAHCEGQSGQATNTNAHCEGTGCKASGHSSHSEGGSCEAAGSSSHSEGEGTKALYQGCHSEGRYTIANYVAQHAQGYYNVGNHYNAFEIGNGSGNNARSDIFEVGWDGSVRATGEILSVLERTTLEADVSKSYITTLKIDVSASGAVTATFTDRNSAQTVYDYSLGSSHTGCFVSVYQTNGTAGSNSKGAVYIPKGSSYTGTYGSSSGMHITATFESFKASVIGEDIVDSHNIKLSDAQMQALSSAVTISGSSQTTVEGAIGALASAVDSIPSVYKPSGDKTCAELTSSLLIAANVGNVYNTTDSGTTTSDFVGGSGKAINIGDNVAVVNTGTDVSPVYKFDLMAGFIDTSNFVQKSSTSGLLKNDGTVDTNSYALSSTVNGILDGTSIDSFADVESALADKVNTSDLPNVSVGSADELNTATPTSNSTVYLHRQTTGGMCAINKIVGGSVVKNQLVSANINTSASTPYAFVQGTQIIQGHKYIMRADFANTTGSASITLYVRGASSSSVLAQIKRADAQYIKIFSASASGVSDGTGQPNTGNTWLYTYIPDGDNTISKVNLIDLTQMFGNTIADYIYTLEQAEAGSGIAKLAEWGFDFSVYHAYDAGSLQSVKLAGKKALDSDNNEIGFTPMSPTDLRGIYSLDASNNLVSDGDEYYPDGGESVKYGISNMGDLNWTYSSPQDIYYTTITGGKYTGTRLGLDAICTKFITTKADYTTMNVGEISVGNYFAGSSKCTVCVKTASGQYADAAAFKTAMNGQYLVYPLATAQTAQLSPYQSLESIASNGTEEYIDYGVQQGTRDLAIPPYSFADYTVGNADNVIASGDIIDGYNNVLREKENHRDLISLLGDDESGRTTASRAYSVNEFFYKDGQIFKVTASIASGAAFTVGTNCTQTTIFAVLTALLNA